MMKKNCFGLIKVSIFFLITAAQSFPTPRAAGICSLPITYIFGFILMLRELPSWKYALHENDAVTDALDESFSRCTPFFGVFHPYFISSEKKLIFLLGLKSDFITVNVPLICLTWKYTFWLSVGLIIEGTVSVFSCAIIQYFL